MKAKARPKVIVARFWKAAGRESEPVREWLLDQAAGDRKDIGGDIHRVETEWPMSDYPSFVPWVVVSLKYVVTWSIVPRA